MIAASTSGYHLPEPLPTTFQTIDEFEKWEHQCGNDGSYEFVRGRIIPKESMKQDELFIVKYLTRLFIKTTAFERGDELIPETDSYVDAHRKRIPDLTYFTIEQQEAIRQGEKASTLFAIEILSDSESHESVLDKLQDYFDGGAQLVWYIVPKRQKIYVYTSPDESKAYKGADIISASPVISDFQFMVGNMFS